MHYEYCGGLHKAHGRRKSERWCLLIGGGGGRQDFPSLNECADPVAYVSWLLIDLRNVALYQAFSRFTIWRHYTHGLCWYCSTLPLLHCFTAPRTRLFLLYWGYFKTFRHISDPQTLTVYYNISWNNTFQPGWLYFLNGLWSSLHFFVLWRFAHLCKTFFCSFMSILMNWWSSDYSMIIHNALKRF